MIRVGKNAYNRWEVLMDKDSWKSFMEQEIEKDEEFDRELGRPGENGLISLGDYFNDLWTFDKEVI